MKKVKTYWEVRYNDWYAKGGSTDGVKGPYETEQAARLAALNLALPAQDTKKAYQVFKVEVHEEQACSFNRQQAENFLAGDTGDIE